MNMRTTRLTFLLVSSFMLHLNLYGQDIFPQTTQDETPTAQADSVILQGFPITEITQAFTETNNLLSEALSRQLTQEYMSAYAEDEATLFSGIDEFLVDSGTIYMDSVSSRELDVISQRAQVYMDQIELMQRKLSKAAEELESESVLLENNKQRWQLTMEQGKETEAVASRMERISGRCWPPRNPPFRCSGTA